MNLENRRIQRIELLIIEIWKEEEKEETCLRWFWTRGEIWLKFLRVLKFHRGVESKNEANESIAFLFCLDFECRNKYLTLYLY